MNRLIRGDDGCAKDVEVARIFKPPLLRVEHARRLGAFLKAIEQDVFSPLPLRFFPQVHYVKEEGRAQVLTPSENVRLPQGFSSQPSHCCVSDRFARSAFS